MSTTGLSFWQFSQLLYQGEGVEDCCIALQDKHGADVNLLLLCCWCGVHGYRLDNTWFRAMLADPQLVVWREQVIEPLRRLRRLLSTQILQGAQQMREEIKGLELEAERLEQDFLLQNLPQGVAAGHGVALLWRNLRAYWVVLQTHEPKVANFMPLLRASYPGCSDKELPGIEEV